jgi:hypothetical protein
MLLRCDRERCGFANGIAGAAIASGETRLPEWAMRHAALAFSLAWLVSAPVGAAEGAPRWYKGNTHTHANPAVYRFRGDETYVRARIRDSKGQTAWTQPVFPRRGVSSP